MMNGVRSGLKRTSLEVMAAVDDRGNAMGRIGRTRLESKTIASALRMSSYHTIPAQHVDIPSVRARKGKSNTRTTGSASRSTSVSTQKSANVRATRKPNAVDRVAITTRSTTVTTVTTDAPVHLKRGRPTTGKNEDDSNLTATTVKRSKLENKEVCRNDSNTMVKTVKEESVALSDVMQMSPRRTRRKRANDAIAGATGSMIDDIGVEGSKTRSTEIKKGSVKKDNYVNHAWTKISPVTQLEQVMKTNVAVPLPKRTKTSGGKNNVKTMLQDAKNSMALVVKKRVVPPKGWRETWNLIWELRADRTAVVDSMGSEALADTAAPKPVKDFQTLVSLMLSSQTKDITNAATMEKLRAYPHGGLTIETVLDMSHETLNSMINKVGFHNRKTIMIKQVAQILTDKHSGLVPDTMDELMELPGVGPKMAIIVLRVAFGKVVGISVDTHVHQIANKLNWTEPGGLKVCNTPEKTRAAIENWIPFDLWEHVNIVLVGLGQEIQTEKPKLLRKCLHCSNPEAAFALLAKLELRKVRWIRPEQITNVENEQKGSYLNGLLW
eukprot:CFRG8164T1